MSDETKPTLERTDLLLIRAAFCEAFRANQFNLATSVAFETFGKVRTLLGETDEVSLEKVMGVRKPQATDFNDGYEGY